MSLLTYIFACIGFVVVVVWLIFLIALVVFMITDKDEKHNDVESSTFCAITFKECILPDSWSECDECPIMKESATVK